MQLSLSALPNLVLLVTLGLVPVATLGNEHDPSTPGTLVAVGADGTAMDMPLRHTSVSVEITAFVARTTVEQVFVNPFEHPIEAIYTFPLGHEAAVDDFELRSGTRVIRGEINRREEARQIYETASVEGFQAALLEQERSNIFTQSVANLPPAGEVRIRLRTVELLVYEAGIYQFTFPLVVGPRYIPGEQIEGAFAETGSAPHPGSASDGQRINPPNLPRGVRSGHDVDIRVALDAGVPVHDLTSPSHDIEVEQDRPDRARVTLGPADRIPNKDFILRWNVSSTEPAVGLLSHREGIEGHFAFIVQPRGTVGIDDAAPKEILFVLDTSGSMSGVPLQMSKAFIHKALRTLGPRDTFNLIQFATGASIYSETPRDSSERAVRDALNWVENLKGSGGTEMLAGLTRAVDHPGESDRFRMIVFLTDGYIGNEDRILSRVNKLPESVRIFTIGIGSSVNHALLDGMASLGGGAYTFIPDGEDMHVALERFTGWVTRPYLTDLEIDWGALPVGDWIPEIPRDLFSGQTLTVVGRYFGADEGSVTLRGRLGGRYWEQEIPVTLPEFEESHAALASVWARGRIQSLLDASPGQVSEQVREEVIDLALEHNVMSPYTSFVAVDYSELVNPGGESETVRQQVPLPEGTTFESDEEPSTPPAARPARPPRVVSSGLAVEVTDASGQPLAGAVVEISHETGNVATTAEISDGAGMVEFPVLMPGGGYSITVAFPGVSTLRYDDLHVAAGKGMLIRAQLIDQLREYVRIVDPRDVVDLDKDETSTRFSDEFISDLPVASRSYQNVLTMAPGVQDVNGDGNPNVNGSRSRDFQAVVSNVNNVDPLTGQWMSRINPNSIEDMEIITAGAGVEFGRAQGGFVRIIQKQGSNTHEGVVELYWRTSKLDGDGANDDTELPDADFDSWQPSFQFSGPLVEDKLWYRVSYEQIDDEMPVNILSGIEVAERTRETQDAQVTWQVSPRNKLALQFRADPDEATNFGISSRVAPESSRAFDRDVETWILNWTAPYSPKVLAETTLAWQDINNKWFPTESGLLNDCVPNSDQPFLNSAYCVDSTRNVVSGSHFRTEDDHRQRFTLKSQAMVYAGRFWGMTHRFKLGVNIENERYTRYLEERPFINYQEISLLGNEDDPGQPPTGEEPSLETIGRVLSRLSVPSEDNVRATGTNWAMYAEDQFKPAQNLTITLGARMDREEVDSGGREPFDPAGELNAFTDYVDAAPTPQDRIERMNHGWDEFFTGYEDLDGYTGQLQNILCEGLEGDEYGHCLEDVSATVLSQSTEELEQKRKATNIHIDNTNVSPFISLAWSPWANGKTAFKASAGRHYNNIPLLIPLQELEPVRTVVEYRASLTDPELCPPPDPDDPNPPSVACGKTKIMGGIEPLLTILTVDRDLETPYQDEFTFKVERELWAETSVSLTYINRRFEDQIQNFNVNLANGDLGRCRRQTSPFVDPIVASPGASKGVCSTSLTPCDTQDPNGCPSGETCGYDYYFVDPADFCFITGDCLTAAFTFAGDCPPGDPYCGIPYPDTALGDGDGFIDPVTGSSSDNCVGDLFTNHTGEEPCGPDDPFCDNVDLLRRPDETTDLYLQNPFWGDIFLIGNTNRIEYEAFVLELVRRQYRGWEMNASYTWSEAEGDGEDFFQELGDDPTLRDSLFGYQSYDQTHVVKVNATTITPWGVRLGSSVTWQSGLPFSLLMERFSFDTKPPITSAFGGDGVRPRQAYVTGVRNDQRNDSFWNVDLKATKELSLAKRMNLQLTAEVFNLLDDGTYQIYNPFVERGIQVNGRNEAQRRFGRRWQVGMKVVF